MQIDATAAFHPATTDDFCQGGRDRAGTPGCSGPAGSRQTETEPLLIHGYDKMKSHIFQFHNIIDVKKII